ncbi:MAG: ribosomal protein L13e [Nitrososphaeraceae archaeon]
MQKIRSKSRIQIFGPIAAGSKDWLRSKVCILITWKTSSPFMKASHPIVRRRIRGIESIRAARGFSTSELKEVGFGSINFARNKGISVDVLRKTTIPENIEKLKLIAEELLHPNKNQSTPTEENNLKRPNKSYTTKEND